MASDHGDDDTTVLWLMSLVPSILSVLGGLAVMMTCIRCSSILKKHVFTMLLHQAVADTLNAVVYLQPPPKDGSLACQIQAGLATFFGEVSILWILMVAIRLLTVRSRRRRRKNKVLPQGPPAEQQDGSSEGRPTIMRDTEVGGSSGKDGMEEGIWSYALFAWGLPALLAAAPYLLWQGQPAIYGSVGPWCWVADTPDDPWRALIWRLGLYYGLLWVTVSVIIIAYLRLLSELRALRGSPSSGIMTTKQYDAVVSGIKRVLAYPAILIFCYTFPTINRLGGGVVITMTNPLWLRAMQSVLAGMHGFLNSLVFLTHPRVREAWASAGGPSGYESSSSASSSLLLPPPSPPKTGPRFSHLLAWAGASEGSSNASSTSGGGGGGGGGGGSAAGTTVRDEATIRLLEPNGLLGDLLVYDEQTDPRRQQPQRSRLLKPMNSR